MAFTTTTTRTRSGRLRTLVFVQSLEKQGIDSEAPSPSAAAAAVQQQQQQEEEVEPLSWMDYYRLLEDYVCQHGHARVAKRDGPLGQWVNRQRQRKHRLDTTRIQSLDAIGFCWNATHDKQSKEQDQWWIRFKDVHDTIQPKIKQQQHGVDVFSTLSSSQKDWLRRQRNLYIDYYVIKFTSSCKLTEKQIDALRGLDPLWYMTSNERKWLILFEVLKQYQQTHGKFKNNVGWIDWWVERRETFVFLPLVFLPLQ
jgi:hypothetical protein